MLKKDLDNELINDQEVIQSLKDADHFYICHYCKKRDTIVGYRTFTDIFNITGRVAKFPTSEAVQ